MKGGKRDGEAKLRTEGGKKRGKLQTHQKPRQWQRLPHSEVRSSAENTARFAPAVPGSLLPSPVCSLPEGGEEAAAGWARFSSIFQFLSIFNFFFFFKGGGEHAPARGTLLPALCPQAAGDVFSPARPHAGPWKPEQRWSTDPARQEPHKCPAWVPGPVRPVGAAGSGGGGCVSDHRLLLNTTIKGCSQEDRPGIKP